MFTGAGFQFLFALGPLMVVALLGSATLAGLSVATQGFSRFIAAYPFGQVTDRYGRKPGLLLGLGLALVGTVLVGTSMNAGSFLGFILGLLIFTIGMNAVQQLRLAAAEMYPPHRRAVVIGYVLTGSAAGAIMSPALVGLAQLLAPLLEADPLAVPWLLLPLLIIPAMVMIGQVRPDPKTIAANLGRYYPHYVPEGADRTPLDGGFGLRRYLSHPDRRLAAVAMFSAQGSMQIAMVTTPLALVHHGVSLTATALALALHSAGMFGPSVPVGLLADRIGRRPVLVLGTALEAIGGAILAFAGEPAPMTIGVLLVGVGWCGANIASTALIIDSTPDAARGRAVGMTDGIAGVAAIVFPLCVGPLLERWGASAPGILATLLMAPPAILFLAAGRRPRAAGAAPIPPGRDCS